MLKPIRIIAWGNKGRQDDGAALILAERLAAHYADSRDVIVQQYHQLGPELIEDLNHCRLAIFVDAHATCGGDVPVAERLAPAVACGGLDTHHCSPDLLLGLAKALGLDVPESWVVGIPGHQWGFGDDFSESTRKAMLRAEREILVRINEAGGGSGLAPLSVRDSRASLLGPSFRTG